MLTALLLIALVTSSSNGQMVPAAPIGPVGPVAVKVPSINTTTLAPDVLTSVHVRSDSGMAPGGPVGPGMSHGGPVGSVVPMLPGLPVGHPVAVNQPQPTSINTTTMAPNVPMAPGGPVGPGMSHGGPVGSVVPMLPGLPVGHPVAVNQPQPTSINTTTMAPNVPMAPGGPVGPGMSHGGPVGSVVPMLPGLPVGHPLAVNQPQPTSINTTTMAPNVPMAPGGPVGPGMSHGGPVGSVVPMLPGLPVGHPVAVKVPSINTTTLAPDVPTSVHVRSDSGMAPGGPVGPGMSHGGPVGSVVPMLPGLPVGHAGHPVAVTEPPITTQSSSHFTHTTAPGGSTHSTTHSPHSSTHSSHVTMTTTAAPKISSTAAPAIGKYGSGNAVQHKIIVPHTTGIHTSNCKNEAHKTLCCNNGTVGHGIEYNLLSTKYATDKAIECCGTSTKSYNPNVEFCCNNTLQNRVDGQDLQCCTTCAKQTVFDRLKEFECGRKIHPLPAKHKIGSNACCNGTTPYDTTTEICCDGVPSPSNMAKGCCGRIPFHSENFEMKCCTDGSISQHKPYNINIAYCCKGKSTQAIFAVKKGLVQCTRI